MKWINLKHSVIRIKPLRLALILMIVSLLYIVYSAYSIWSYGQRTELLHADAAIVLGAATYNGEPSPVFKARIDHALNLYHNGSVRKLIFTGGSGEQGEISEAETAQVYAIDHEVKAEDIIIETFSTITEENIRNANIIAEQNGVSSFLIVSDPLHMKRAMMIAQDMGLNAHSSPAQNSAYQSLRTKLPFLAREVFYYIGYQVVAPFR